MSQSLFHGIIAYPITPFDQKNGRLNIKAFKDLIDRLINNGVHSIAALGSTGESAYLNDAEWDEIAEVTVKHVNRRVPVIIGVSDLTTKNTVRRAKFAENVGANAVMVLPISYWKLSAREITSHYEAIANAISLPIMVYNNPATSGIDLSPELIVSMMKNIDNITMVKESSGDIQRMNRLMQLTDGQILLYNGCNPLALEAFAAGAVGWCTAAPNLIPNLTLNLYEAISNGDLEKAKIVFYKQLSLLQFIVKGGLPTTIKAGLTLLGCDVGVPRQPLLPLKESDSQQLADIFKDLNLEILS